MGKCNKETNRQTNILAKFWQVIRGPKVRMLRKRFNFVKMRSKWPRGKKLSSEGCARALKIVLAGG